MPRVSKESQASFTRQTGWKILFFLFYFKSACIQRLCWFLAHGGYSCHDSAAKRTVYFSGMVSICEAETFHKWAVYALVWFAPHELVMCTRPTHSGGHIWCDVFSQQLVLAQVYGHANLLRRSLHFQKVHNGYLSMYVFKVAPMNFLFWPSLRYLWLLESHHWMCASQVA